MCRRQLSNEAFSTTNYVYDILFEYRYV